MKIPCDSFSRCIDPAEPTANFSSEDEDINHTFCYGSGNGSRVPPPGYNWDTQNCHIVWGTVVCTVAEDEDCQVCVQNSKWVCNPDDPPHPPFPPLPPDPIEDKDPRYIWPNTATRCQVKCKDGLEFDYWVPYATFFAGSTYMANQIAYKYACKQAKAHKLCLGNMTNLQGCLGDEFLCNVSVTGKYSGPSNYWQIVSGSLPPGMNLSSASPDGATASISGTPTASGSYTFTLRVTVSTGDYMQKQFTICVIGITCDPAGSDDSHLPDATSGSEYNVTIKSTSCATPTVTFHLKPGSALPTGFTLDEATGVIHCPAGQATPPNDYTFTIQILTDSEHET